MKKAIITIIIIILIVLGIYVAKRGSGSEVVNNANIPTVSPTVTPSPEPVDKTKTVIGKSVEGRDIIAYHFGEGDQEILLVAGIHGGYEWNTALLGNELVKHFRETPGEIPTDSVNKLKLTIIPVLNPDGLAKVIGTTTDFTKAQVSSSQETQIAGRFNGNNVDLNRNFDCDWQPEAKWQNKTVSGGTSAFSEPESQAVKNYIETNKPIEVIVYYSAAGGVFASSCHGGVPGEMLTGIYAGASGYPAHKSFDFYEITGDMVNWLAKQNIPAISVLLTNHTDTEFAKNLKGIQMVIKRSANPQ